MSFYTVIGKLYLILFCLIR